MKIIHIVNFDRFETSVPPRVGYLFKKAQYISQYSDARESLLPQERLSVS